MSRYRRGGPSLKSASIIMAMAFLGAGTLSAQPLALDAAILGSGGGELDAGTFSVGLALGQPAVGRTEDGTLSVALGLFAGRAVVGVSAGDDATPLRFVLGTNYPNPFARSTSIAYELPQAVRVRVEVYDVLGRRVRTLVDEEQEAGPHTVTLTRDGLASGAYLYRLTAGSQTATRQMQLIR